MRNRGLLQFAVGVILALGLGCASARAPQHPDVTISKVEAPSSERGWWFARFIVQWPQGSEPLWPMDLLLAHEVVSPVLQRWRSDIALWRFHRRAARDQTGHQFSFIFYSSPQTARSIFDSIRNDENLIALKSAGLIVRDLYDDTSTIAKPHIEDTSDPHWSPQIQKSWPYYAMGASETWLSLIDEMAKTVPGAGKPATPLGTLEFYKKVNEAVKTAWQGEGSHAFLHHLNAIFGYEPVMVIERRMMTF